MTRVTAPYNFVPLSRHVCKAADLAPALAAPPSQDVPEPGSLSGSIDVTLTCDTAILVSWRPEEDRIRRFGHTPDGTPAIPGSTLRGMVRNVLEIASFGKMSLVDGEARPSVRDLNPTARLDYGAKMSSVTASGAFLPLSQPGWLTMEGATLKVTPCEFARIDHDDLETISADFRTRVRARDDNTLAQVVEEVYREIDEEGNFRRGLECELHVQDAPMDHQHGLKDPADPARGYKYLSYRRAAFEPGTAASGAAIRVSCQPGTLVFTGMPSNRKHMEFFFYGDKNGAAVVPKQVWTRFRDVHERQEKESDTWKWRRQTLYNGDRIPVFYLTDANGAIEHLGLAMMFKLPADRTIGEMIRCGTSNDHLDATTVDLADRIFGRLESEKRKGDGWRGRVSFGWALATGGWDHAGTQTHTVILAKPKPGFPAAYVRQRDFTSGDWKLMTAVVAPTGNPVTAQYRSYMNCPAGQPETEEIRGWKRYPVGPLRGPGPDVDENASTTRLYPLRPAQQNQPITFTFALRYHNLQPVELGALIWAATWGGDDTLRHAVGMGRPYGWGQVKLAASLDDAQKQALTTYIDKMETWAQAKGLATGWRQSFQIVQLCAMADPAIGAFANTLLGQMRIVVGQRNGNDFASAKQHGYVLPEYPASVGVMASPVPGQPASMKCARRREQPRVPVLLRFVAVPTQRREPKRNAYKVGDKVNIRTTNVQATGVVARDTEPDGKTLVTYYRTRREERRGEYSQTSFSLTELTPLPGPAA